MEKDETKIGLFYGVATFVMWGIFPIYFKLLKDVDATEILAHRIFWSAIFVFLFIKFSNKMMSLKRYFLDRNVVFKLVLSGFFVAVNWGIYIYAVNSNQILEASLGYFINPLMYIILGAIVFKEKPSTLGKISIAIVVCAILLQIFILGKIPFIAILLPALFAIYGLIKKKLAVPSFEGLFIETFFWAIFALIYIVFLQVKGSGSFGFNQIGFLLVISGIVTVAPLLTFNSAATKLKLSTIGYLQYISPTMTTLLAIFLYKEEFDVYRLISFVMIWISLILITINGIKGAKSV
ncbi:EamA family transporter RarD [Campylobacter geochelonis]|uniref:RarD protein n=1 Tax=Campylobacter geochelonis TaxID=1780362 RepID=A0A128EJD1_9BACT|nr:EamA family transporter RarD [Campylobacter geochelonis]QKF71135.1 resistance permease RarD [Campylobacter geochelonis]CZE48259.1 RarD protein [Campylobacter geochelonis]CZE48964.1 RarD protein [Campylobacter geochelonis]CZE50043.1 RarD protein [Campylobacter geochelonis]